MRINKLTPCIFKNNEPVNSKVNKTTAEIEDEIEKNPDIKRMREEQRINREKFKKLIESPGKFSVLA